MKILQSMATPNYDVVPSLSAIMPPCYEIFLLPIKNQLKLCEMIDLRI